MLNNTIIPQDARAWAERVIRSPIKWTGDNGLTNCPLSSHGGPDRHPSFSVDVSKQVYFCHTEQVGGSFRELGKLIGEEWLGDRPSTSKPKKEIEAVYDYTDATGKLIYQVVRYNPKDFKQRRPDGKGGHTWNIQGVTLLPYKLLELLRVKPGQTIFIVEGEKDVQSLNKMGLVATCNHGGAGKWREEHSRHFPKGASVVILPDNDDPGQMHSVMVARSLIKRGCKVKVVELPGLPPKSDVSDWLKSGRTKDELLKLVMDADDWRDKELDVDVGGDKAQLKDNPYAHLREHLKQEDYAVNSHGELCYMKYDQNGKGTLTAIANFVAWPIRQIAKDNGIDRTTKFEIVGLASGGIPLPAAMVPSEKFAQMQWAIDAWGLRANIKPGAASKDKIRYITQALGINAPKDLLFGHLGWKKIDGKWAYLHAGGAINNADAIVDLNDEGLTSYELPPAVKDAKEAMQCSLQTLNLAPRSVTMSLFSLIFLAPLCEPLRKANLEPAFLLWLNGTTGSMKSTLAALFTSHFGIFSGKSLPASFKDTANSLERKAFFTKDSVLVVDDYHPNSSQSEALKMREAAERLLRGYGDRIGRGRLNADSSAKKTFVPQGLCIVTGEDLPEGGQSAASRYLGIDLERGDIDLTLLTELQGKSDYLREAMRSYIESLSIEKMPNVLKQRFIQFREKATTAGQHSRVPETVAWLQIGLMAGLEHAINVGAITELEKSKLSLEGWEVFMKLAEKHSLTIEAETPVRKYLNALSEMLTNKTLRVVETSMGKGLDNDGFAGWEDKNWYYLLPGTVYNAVSRFYQARGGSFPLGESVILKQFEKAGIIFVENGKQIRRTHRYTFSGERVTVIKLSKSALNESQEISTKTTVSQDNLF